MHSWLLFVPESILRSNNVSAATPQPLIGLKNIEQRVATVIDSKNQTINNDLVEPLGDLVGMESALIVAYDSNFIRDSLFLSPPTGLEAAAPGVLSSVGPRLDVFRRHLGEPSNLARPAAQASPTDSDASSLADQTSSHRLWSQLATALGWSRTVHRLRSAGQNLRLTLLSGPGWNPHAAAQLALQLCLGVLFVTLIGWFCRTVGNGFDSCCPGNDCLGGCAFALRRLAAQLELGLRSALDWLRRDPVGLKLHGGTARVLAQGLAYQLSIWHQWTDTLQLPAVTTSLWRVHLLLTLLGGAPCQLALLSDYCRLLALHLRLLEALCWRLCGLQVRLLTAAARLLRGRKWNPLRLRSDSAPYQLDQLLLCTLLFAVLLFLLPTFAAFAAVLLAFHLVWLAADWCLLAMTSATCQLPALLLALWLFDHRSVYALPRFEAATASAVDEGSDEAVRDRLKLRPHLRLRLSKISLRQALKLGPAFYRV